MEFYNRKVLKALPSAQERKRGWRVLKLTGRPRNAFLTSSILNSTIVSDGGWNPKIVVDESNIHYGRLLSKISTHEQHMREMIKAKIEKAITDPRVRPLINERKIALTSDFEVQMTEIHAFQSCYFASMLTTDISCKDLTLSNELGDTVISKAKRNFPMQKEQGKDCIPSISKSANYISNQLGINIILLTKDYHLVFPRQNLSAN